MCAPPVLNVYKQKSLREEVPIIGAFYLFINWFFHYHNHHFIPFGTDSQSCDVI